MATFKNTRLGYSLTSTGVPGRTAASGEVALGASKNLDFGNVPIASVQIANITTAINPVLNLYAMTVTGGIVVDAGVNFEGLAVTNINTLAILIERTDNDARDLFITGSGSERHTLKPGGFVLMGQPAAVNGNVLPDATLTFAALVAGTMSVRVSIVCVGS